MKKSEVYNELRKVYSDEELADSFIFSVDAPEEEEKSIRDEFLKLRMKRLDTMSEEEKIEQRNFLKKLSAY